MPKQIEAEEGDTVAPWPLPPFSDIVRDYLKSRAKLENQYLIDKAIYKLGEANLQIGRNPAAYRVAVAEACICLLASERDMLEFILIYIQQKGYEVGEFNVDV